MICTEAFSCLLLAAETTGKLSGIKVCQNAPSINHLLFADDSLLLLKANEWSANHLQNILSLYEDCSGQTINKNYVPRSCNVYAHELARCGLL
jgi:hypothetical protein